MFLADLQTRLEDVHMSEDATTLRRDVIVGAHVTREQHDRLRARATTEDRSVSSIIRRAIDRELEREERS
jgi:Ribbon-helix-helix protein, copG family